MGDRLELCLLHLKSLSWSNIHDLQQRHVPWDGFPIQQQMHPVAYCVPEKYCDNESIELAELPEKYYDKWTEPFTFLHVETDKGLFFRLLGRVSWSQPLNHFKGVEKSIFMHHSCVVIILFITQLCKPAFSAYSLKN